MLCKEEKEHNLYRSKCMTFPPSNAAPDATPDDTSGSSPRGIFPLLAAPGGLAVVVACVLVWAEQRQYWLVAQASVGAALLLLALSVWVWWQKRNRHPHLSAAAHVYHEALRKVLLCVAIGIAALILNGIRIDRWRYGQVAQAVGYGILFAGAAFISGVMLGYLFGLRPAGAAKGADGKSSTAIPQSNLEEIADWLTKLILGAGLVALTKLSDPILKFADFMASGVYPQPLNHVPARGVEGNPAIALAIMGFFSTCGLLYGYLWTRYELAITSDKSCADTRHTPDDQTLADMTKDAKSTSSAGGDANLPAGGAISQPENPR